MKLVKPKELFRKVYKSGSAEQGRLLGLDVGNKYVGLAISDACNKIASPVSVLVRKKTKIDHMTEHFKTLSFSAENRPNKSLGHVTTSINTNFTKSLFLSLMDQLGLLFGPKYKAKPASIMIFKSILQQTQYYKQKMEG